MPKRGEVWWVNFDPAVGVEIRKRRLAVVVSNDAANRHLNRVQVVPLSSQVDRIYPSEAPVSFQGRAGKAMADQLTTVSKLRLVDCGGSLTAGEMAAVERAILIQLGMFGG
ncbi:MAG: type II toxin-antitoxin system PemK/MazF family toxin [Anaerolineae bacterium]|nr:type II toxin-antitoxin system PemK/MazF family toxin [Anaerolineae bacterium]